MDLELSDDQHELRDNIRTVLEGACPPAVVRGLHDGTDDALELWAQMTELHWPAIAIDEEHGGLGTTFVEVGLLAEELGRATAPGPLLATATQFTPVLREVGGDLVIAVLREIAAGQRTGALASAEEDRWELDAIAATARSEGDDWILDGMKTAVLSATEVDTLAVVARTSGSSGSDGLGVFLVDPADVAVTARSVVDPTLPLADVKLTACRVGATQTLARPGEAGVAEALTRAGQQATVAMALSTVGACRRIFELTLDYAKVREQYDQVIGSFQALKHRFADMYLAVERANAVAYYAALTIAEDDPRRDEATHLAKAAAGDCQRLLAQEGLQLHGGIGYTWENDLHFLLKRAKAGEALCGSASYHRARLARLLGLVDEKAA